MPVGVCASDGDMRTSVLTNTVPFIFRHDKELERAGESHPQRTRLHGGHYMHIMTSPGLGEGPMAARCSDLAVSTPT